MLSANNSNNNNNKKKNVYQLILEISELAENMEFENKKQLRDNDNDIKKIINKPKEFKKFAYEAYNEFFSNKKE